MDRELSVGALRVILRPSLANLGTATGDVTMVTTLYAGHAPGSGTDLGTTEGCMTHTFYRLIDR